MRISPPPGRAGYRWRRLPGSRSLVPRHFVADGEYDGVRFEIEVEVDAAGHSVCRRAEFTPGPDAASITDWPSRAALLQVATASAAQWIAYDGRTPDGGWRGSPPTRDEAAAAAHQQLARRPSRRRDAPDYERAGMIWTESGGDVTAVMDEFSVSQQTAYRYIARARDLGYLPPAASRRAA